MTDETLNDEMEINLTLEEAIDSVEGDDVQPEEKPEEPVEEKPKKKSTAKKSTKKKSPSKKSKKSKEEKVLTPEQLAYKARKKGTLSDVVRWRRLGRR
jgi:FKBP-type peptidyl-prolyl cis-trans isomerase